MHLRSCNESFLALLTFFSANPYRYPFSSPIPIIPQIGRENNISAENYVSRTVEDAGPYKEKLNFLMRRGLILCRFIIPVMSSQEVFISYRGMLRERHSVYGEARVQGVNWARQGIRHKEP